MRERKRQIDEIEMIFLFRCGEAKNGFAQGVDFTNFGERARARCSTLVIMNHSFDAMHTRIHFSTKYLFT